MADKTISDLTAVTSIAATDVFVIDTAGGNSRKATREVLRSSLFSGAQAYVGTNLTGQNFTASVAIPFNTEAFDTDGYHSTVTNTSRLTAPADGYYEAFFNVQVNSNTLANYLIARIFKSGDGNWPGLAADSVELTSTTAHYLSASTGPIFLTAGEYLEVILLSESDTSVDIIAENTWFSIRRVG